MATTNEFLTFSNSDECFYENNLLDANDWGKEFDLASLNSSPTSSLESEQNFVDVDYNHQSWLLDDDIDVWLQNEINPQCIIKQEPKSPEYPPVTSSQSSLENKHLNETPIQITSLTQNQVAASNISSKPSLSNICKNISIPTNKINFLHNNPNKILNLKKVNTVSVNNNLKTVVLPSLVNPKTRATNSIHATKNTLLMKQIQPAALKTKVLVSPSTMKTGVVTAMSPHSPAQPQIVKLENGQYYVAPSMINQNTNIQQSNMKACLKRPSDIKAETLLSTAKDFSEFKNNKRQQRMMKNRESACLSRQRKKQHLESLEVRVAEISELNAKLKIENENLKHRVQSLEVENKELREQPSPAKSHAKKTFLFAVMVFFALNTIRLHSAEEKKNPHKFIHKSRSLLQYDNSNINAEVYPKLPNNYIFNKNLFNSAGAIKNKNMFEEKHGNKFRNNDLKQASLDDDLDCGEQFNQTHMTRINQDLEGLAKGMHKSNKKTRSKYNNSTLKNNCDENCSKNLRKKPPLRHVAAAPYIRFLRSEKIKKAALPLNNSPKNTSQELASLIQKSIIRKPDTFYVVSLLKDVMILPATNYSSTQRPKVTFMLPAYLPNMTDTKTNESGIIPILQIECNVIDTKLLRLERSFFSESLLTQLSSK